MVTSPLEEIEPLMFVVDVANVLGLEEKTVLEKLVKTGRLRSERLGNTYVVHPDSVRKYYFETFGSDPRAGAVAVPESRESA